MTEVSDKKHFYLTVMLMSYKIIIDLSNLINFDIDAINGLINKCKRLLCIYTRCL